MSPPLVTVLIDTYNYGHFIEEAIDSVLAQDFPAERMQIVVVDDGSTDDTAERVKKYGSRIQYFYKPNGGQASAFNLGLNKAQGEIVALLDADDYWLPQKLRRITEEFEKHPEAGMVYHQLMQFEMASGKREPAKFVALSGDLRAGGNSIFWHVPHATSCLAFRRECLECVTPVPEGLRTQADGYVSTLAAFAAPILAIPECLAVYRIHGQNLYSAEEYDVTPEVRRRRVEVRAILMRELRGWLGAHGYDTEHGGVRAFLERWRLYQEKDEFLLAPPGRVRYFRHLLLYNRCYWRHMGVKLRLINYANALGALVVGYKHFYLLDKWREGLRGTLRR
jgi:glycosyltransferase involved in cell wall biosynthesis